MRILIISLLRIGDLFMQKPLVQALKDRYPNAEIDLVVNSVSLGATRLFSDIINNVYIFSRDEYQRSAGEAHFNILAGISEIDNLIDSLSDRNYDVVYNFTHNRLSGYFAGAINARECKGLSYKNGQFSVMENPWMNYLNTCYSQKSGSIFHYTEVLANSFDLNVSKHKIRSSHKKSGLILMQCFTSEARKNWSLLNFLDLKNKIESFFPFHIVRILATEKERLELRNYFSDEYIWVADLPMSESLLKEARLFIGVDTSIKHLAALCGTPCIELALGGSDPIKTGAFIEGAISLVSEIDISVEQVFSATVNILSLNNELETKAIEQNQNLECDKWVWSQLLGGYKATVPAVPLTNASYVAKSFKLLEWQLRLENALLRDSNFKSYNAIIKEDLKDYILVAQEILKSNIDSGGYFQKLIEVLTTTDGRGNVLYLKLVEAVEISRALLVLRSEIAIGGIDVAEPRKALEIGA